MHDDFFAVGVDAVETASFGSFSVVLAEYGIAERTHELNVHAARLAREVADDHEADGRTRYVAGSIGPGTKLPSLGHIRFADLRDAYAGAGPRAARGRCRPVPRRDLHGPAAGQGGDDRLPASHAPQTVDDVPIQVQVTMETTGRMLVGSEIGAALASVAAMRPDVLGINCATGPAEMQEHLRYLSQNCPFPIAVLPNAGLPSIVDGRTHYDLRPDELATFHRHHVADLGIGIVGGCCGTTPEHLRQVVEAVARTRAGPPDRRRSSRASPRSTRRSRSPRTTASSSSASAPTPTVRRAFRDAMLADDWDACSKIATEQIREGAHVLDVCVDYVGRDGTARHGRDRVAVRHPGERPARARLDRAPGARSRAAAHRRPSRAQLGQPRGRRACRVPDSTGCSASPANTAQR